MVELTSLSQTSTNTEYCIGRIEGVMDGIDELVGGYGHVDSNCTQRLLSLRGRLSRMLLAWRSNVVQQCSIATAGSGAAIEVRDTTARGRPKVYINVDQVELLYSAGYTWSEVAECFLVSRTTIWRRLREAGVATRKYTDISDAALDAILCNIRHRHPHSGQSMIQGMLTGMGYHLQRYRVRESLQRIDPLGNLLRRHQPQTIQCTRSKFLMAR